MQSNSTEMAFETFEITSVIQHSKKAWLTRPLGFNRVGRLVIACRDVAKSLFGTRVWRPAKSGRPTIVNASTRSGHYDCAYAWGVCSRVVILDTLSFLGC